MNAVKHCDLCETPLEFTDEGGACLRFTAHDAAFCETLTKHRIRMLQRALAQDAEIIGELKYSQARLGRRADVAIALGLEMDSSFESAVDAETQRRDERDRLNRAVTLKLITAGGL